MIIINMFSLISFSLIYLLIFRQVISGEKCTSKIGATTVTITCSDNESCCNDDTQCCPEGISTVVLVAFVVGGTVILAIIIIIVIYAIVNHNKKKNPSQVQPDSNAHFGEPPPFYTPRDQGHPLPAPPAYETLTPSSSNDPHGESQAGQLSQKVPL